MFYMKKMSLIKHKIKNRIIEQGHCNGEIKGNVIRNVF